MASPRLLISGDYWHADFRDLLARMSVPATLTPLDQLEAMDTQRFNLILIAQSRSNQFDQAAIDSIVSRIARSLCGDLAAFSFLVFGLTGDSARAWRLGVFLRAIGSGSWRKLDWYC